MIEEIDTNKFSDRKQQLRQMIKYNFQQREARMEAVAMIVIEELKMKMKYFIKIFEDENNK